VRPFQTGDYLSCRRFGEVFPVDGQPQGKAQPIDAGADQHFCFGQIDNTGYLNDILHEQKLPFATNESKHDFAGCLIYAIAFMKSLSYHRASKNIKHEE
jgi:hypothetical protein